MTQSMLSDEQIEEIVYIVLNHGQVDDAVAEIREYLTALALPAAPAGNREAVDETAKAEGMDEAADFVLERLAKALGLTTFEPQEGTETWDGDVVATLNHILIAAGVVDDETGSLRILRPEHSAVIDAAAKYAEQRRIGRLFTDQDVLDACAALSRARTGSEAQNG